MGQRKKQGKERLDKYYHLAKTQGYRARSAFKLIQLNKKFGFLEKARVCIDLCAAPGGWLQVAAKQMPVSSLIIGVDLAPIKPIPKVITHVEDITTEKCRTTLKKDMKDWKADVVLHDGAPNVGTAWVQDAFSQSELTLSALKLAVEFLAKGGVFVTKVFRSKDYNNLLWVFKQLFKKVDATKPPSSRNVSAEIFVVCRDFLDPKKIDPRFLDPKYVFKEISDRNPADGDLTSAKQAMNDILNPEKATKKRHREGYEDGDYVLEKTESILGFLLVPSEANAIQILASCNKLNWDLSISPFVETLIPKSKEEGEAERNLQDPAIRKAILKKITEAVPEEIKTCCADLKVLGRKDFKAILKWRSVALKELGLAKEKSEKKEVTEQAEIEPLSIEDELEALTEESEKKAKKEKRKRRERLAKDRRRLQLNMATPIDIDQQDDLIATAEADVDRNIQFSSKQSSLLKLEDSGDEAFESEEEELVWYSDSQSQDEDVDETDESAALLKRHAELDKQVDAMYQEYVDQKLAQDPKLRVKQIRAREAEFRPSDELNNEEVSESENETEPVAEIETERLSKQAEMWFDQDLFEGIDLSEPEKKVSNHNSSAASKKQKPRNGSDDQQDNSRMKTQSVKQNSELMQASTIDPLSTLSTAEAITLAMKMVQDGGREARDVLDTYGYNRYTFADDPASLPKWFVDDESQHNKPHIPISKDAVNRLKTQQRELDARPIKKVMEAKARKKFKTANRLNKLRKKMNDMIDEDGNDNGADPELGSKLGQIQTIMKKALGKAKAAQRSKVELVVARGSNRGNAGRPKGVKGRYKMVDSRMKKEVRAQKRSMEKKKSKK